MRPGRDLLAIPLLLAFQSVTLAQEVTLPLSTYNELRSRANPSPTPTPAPAAPWAIESAATEVGVTATSGRVMTRLVVSLFSPEWQEITLPPVGRLLAADLGDLQGRMAAGDAWVLHVKGLGRHVVRLDSVVEVTEDQHSTRPERNALIRLPSAAACTGWVKAGPEVEEVAFSGATGSGRGPGGEWTFVGVPSNEFKIRLLGKAVAAERQKLPLRFLAQTSSLTTIARTRTRMRAWLSVRVRQGQLEELQTRLPSGFTVVSVGGDPLGGWDVKDGVLSIRPAAPVEGAFNADVNLTSDTVTELASPVLLPLGTARTAVMTAVQVEGDGLLELLAAASGRPPDDRERGQVPPEFRRLARFPMLVMDPAQPPRWAVTWPEKGEVLAAQVDRLVVDILVGEAGAAAYQCWAEVRNAGATSVAFAMPPGFELVEADRDGARVSAGVGSGGLVVPLAAGGGGQVIHLSGLLPVHVPDRDDTLTLPMPALSAPVGSVEFRLALPGGRSYRAKSVETVAWVEPPRSAALNAAGKGLLAQQVQANTQQETRAGGALFPAPPGSAILLGRWSALSAKPGPILVETEILSSKWGWF